MKDNPNCTRPPVDRHGPDRRCEVSEPQNTTPCICGAQLILSDADTEYPSWRHEGYGAHGCKSPIPAGGLPTAADRDTLDKRLKKLGEGLTDAGQDMKALRAQLDAIDDKMNTHKFDHLARDVRYATLTQVWDKLIEGGHFQAAVVVSLMMDNRDMR